MEDQDGIRLSMVTSYLFTPLKHFILASLQRQFHTCNYAPRFSWPSYADKCSRYGTNSDEGTDNAPPNGVINTDNDLFTYLHGSTGFDLPSFAVRRIMELYPDDPTVGIPLNTGSERFSEHGYQYKRIAAILGDVFYHAPRRDDAMSYTKFASGESKTYSYRFNTRAWVNGTNATFTDTTGSFAPAYKGVAHASEITFVFNNPD